jgi:hypothetical protein
MRLGEQIWHCKRISKKNETIPKFQLPIAYTLKLHWLTVQPSGSGYSEVVEHGEDIKKYQTIMAQPYQLWHGVFSEGDRLYLDDKQPDENDVEDIYAESANYIIDSVRNQNEAIRIVAKKRTAE